MTKRFDTRWRVSARYDEHDAMKAAVGYNTQMKLEETGFAVVHLSSAGHRGAALCVPVSCHQSQCGIMY